MLSSVLYCDYVSIDWLSKLCSFKSLSFTTLDFTSTLCVFWRIFGPSLPIDWMSELGVKKWLISTSSANWVCHNLAAGRTHRENGLKLSQRILRLRTLQRPCVLNVERWQKWTHQILTCTAVLVGLELRDRKEHKSILILIEQKKILIPIHHLRRSVSRQSVVDGGKLITSSEETTSLKMVIVILISWLSSWIQFLFLGNYLPSHVPCQIQSFL